MSHCPDKSALDRVRELIQKNDLRTAIDLLASLLKGADSELYNECIGQSARLVAIRARERQGVATPAEVEAAEARLRLALLGLVDEIPETLERRQMPFPTPPVRFEPPTQASFEKIIGANNLKSIAWLRRGLEAARAVCRVNTPNGRGTGFLIAGGRLVTNNHVLPTREVAEASQVEFNYEEGLDGKIQDSTPYRVRGETFQTDVALDVSVVSVDPGSPPTPLTAWGFLELAAGPEPRTGDHVTIIQHPLGGPKQLAITANQVVNLYEFRLHYTTDTQPGSSGSPVFNDDWRVIALHHAGGDLIVNARGERMYANEGVLVSSILARVSHLMA